MIPNYDVLIVGNSTRVDRILLEAGCNGGRLKIIGKSAMGHDNIDYKAVAEFGILFIHTPEAFTLSCAEFTCGMLLAMSRNMPQACDSMRRLAGIQMFGISSHESDEEELEKHMTVNFQNQCEWGRNAFTGVELYSKVLGIIGLGQVGTAVATRMASFGMKILAYDPHVCPKSASNMGIECVSLQDLFQNSDFISLHAAYNNTSHHIVNSTTLALCKKNVCLINCAHNGLINENDLILALNNGNCAAAAIDTYDEDPVANMAYIGHPKIICTPNLSTCTVESKRRVSLELLQRLKQAIVEHWNVVPIPTTTLTEQNRGMSMTSES